MINIKIRDLFFDSDKVIASTSAGERKSMSAYGAAVRLTAIKSMFYRVGSAPAGSPPNVHRTLNFHRTTKSGKVLTLSPLRELISFSYSPEEHSVVIGPSKSDKSTGAPSIMEHGGVAPAHYNPRRLLRVVGGAGEIRIVRGGKISGKNAPKWLKKNKDGQWVAYGKLQTPAQATRANRLNEELYGPSVLPAKYVAARPFMMPAAQANVSVIPASWRS